MNKDIKILAVAAFLLFGGAAAFAGTATIGVTAGSGKLYDVVTDGSGNYIGIMAIGDGTAAANYAAVKPASTAAVATDPALVVTISPNGVNPNGAAASSNSAPVVIATDQGALLGYPSNVLAITASATGTTTATTATLAATTGKTTYLCGFSIRANATAAATGNATVTGTVTGTLNFTQWTAPLASGIGITEPPIGPQCIPASGTNTSIAVVSAAPGSGGVVSVSAWGYQR